MKKIYYKYYIKKLLKLNNIKIIKQHITNEEDNEDDDENEFKEQSVNKTLINNDKAEDDENEDDDDEDDDYDLIIIERDVNIKDEMIKYHLNLSNFKSIIIKKQLKQFCVTFLTYSTYKTLNNTNNISYTTTKTNNIINNLYNLLINIYKAHFLLVALTTTTILTQLNSQNLKQFNINMKNILKPKTRNALLLRFIKDIVQHQQKPTTIKKICCFKNQDFRLPFAIKLNTTNNSNSTNNNTITTIIYTRKFCGMMRMLMATPLLVVAVKETNEPLPKFFQDNSKYNMKNYQMLLHLIVDNFLKFVIITISIIDLFINFINIFIHFYYNLLLILFVSITMYQQLFALIFKTLKTTISLKSSNHDFKNSNDSFSKHFIDNFFAKPAFSFLHCFNFITSNYL